MSKNKELQAIRRYRQSLTQSMTPDQREAAARKMIMRMGGKDRVEKLIKFGK